VLTSAVLGVLTAGVVLVVTAPAPRGRAPADTDTRRAILIRDLGDELRTGDWEGVAILAASMLDEFPEDTYAWMRLAQARERLGLPGAAEHAWNRLDELTAYVDAKSHPHYRELHRRGWALHARGDAERARILWAEAAHQIDRNTAWRTRDEELARYYSLAGWTDRALAALEVAMSGEPHLFANIAYEPDFEPIRDDPRFAALVERVQEARERRRREREDRERQAAPPPGP